MRGIYTPPARGARGRRRVMWVVIAVAAVVGAIPATAGADQASQPGSLAAGRVATGKYHSCAVLVDASTRCWGYGGDGALGYANTNTIGDDETPASGGPVDVGLGRSAKAISAGSLHTCALLDDATVRCWGYGGDGRLGYGNTISIGASQTPGSVGPVDLGSGHTAKAISAGVAHTCAVLDDDTVRCWGFGYDGRLGYGPSTGRNDVDSPASVGPVDLGGHTARAVSAGGSHTCALLDDGNVLCWGFGGNGQLGYGNTDSIGVKQTPGSVGPVYLGGHTAKAVSAGSSHTCAVLDDGSVRCWGFGANGRLGYGSTANVGDTPSTTPGKVGAVNLGSGHTAVAISAGGDHTCAVLDDASVRCWGYGALGQLGYANTRSLGDASATTPDKVGPVDLGAGRSAMAISTGELHTCALLDDSSVRCWGYGAFGRLGYCHESDVGDVQTPGSVGPVNLRPGDGGAGCASTAATPGGGSGATPGTGGHPPATGAKHGAGGHPVDPRRLEALRARGLRRCLVGEARRARRHRSTRRHKSRARSSCLRRYGRIPGRITRLHARAVSRTEVALSFVAPGSNGPHPPAARAYLIRQSRRPIGRGRNFRDAQTLCQGSCRFHVAAVGTEIKLTITHLRPHSTYYYAIAARDNVSNLPGPPSASAQVRTQ